MNLAEKVPAPRIPLKLDVEYRKSYGRSGEMGHLKNISLSGAFLEHENEALKEGDKVILENQN